MLNPIEFIQKNILRDPSPILTPILTGLFNEILKEVYDYHDWRFLQEDATKTLETDKTEYDLSGNNQDLERIVGIYYGEEMDELEEYSNKEFYRRIFNKIPNSTPIIFIPLKRPNPFTWTVRIYPCSEDSLETLTYWYMKKIKPSDFNLFPNPMVLVDGVLWRFFTKEEKHQQAHDFKESYFLGRELMKQNDTPTVYPRSKIVSSDRRLRAVAIQKSLQNQRRR
jgi:hypothetical protein